MKKVVLDGLRLFLFGLAADFHSSSAIQDISAAMRAPLWVKGPVPAGLLCDWMTPEDTSRRGEWRSLINMHCLTVTVTVTVTVTATGCKLLCTSTFLYRCSVCQVIGSKDWILQHLRVRHLFEKVECAHLQGRRALRDEKEEPPV